MESNIPCADTRHEGYFQMDIPKHFNMKEQLAYLAGYESAMRELRIRKSSAHICTCIVQTDSLAQDNEVSRNCPVHGE